MTREEAIKWLSLYVGNDGYTDEYQEVCRMAIAALRERPQWISVEDRLPQEYGATCENVILLMDNGFVTVGWLNQVTNRGYYLNAYDDVIIRVPLSRFTHWMPLPEGPKEEV